MDWLWAPVAVVIAFGAALAFYAARQWRGSRRAAAWLASSLMVGFAPCFVSLAITPWRFLASIVSVALLVKLYDLFRQPEETAGMSAWAYALYLTNWFWLVLDRKPLKLWADSDWAALVRAMPMAAGLVTASCVAFSMDYSGVPFVVEHSVKVPVFVLTVVVLANCGARVWRLLGGVALTPMNHPAAARTPADFWRRWNRPVNQFLHEHVFLPCGGVRRPIRAAAATFFVSGLAHEYVFGIASGRVQGWQMLFFGVQGAAAIATSRVRPRGWQVWPAMGATMLFNLLTAVLFFKSVDAVVPFYSLRAS